MPVRLLPFFALLLAILGLVTEPAPSLLAQQAGSGPPVIFRIRDIDSLQTDLKYLIKQAGQEEFAKQVDELVSLWVQGSGVDTKKPLGGYGNITPEGTDPSAVFLVPISDEKAFLKKIDDIGYVRQTQGGVHTLSAVVNKQDAYLRFANGYGYISNDKKSVADPQKLVTPGLIFDAKDKSAIALILRIGQVSKSLKDYVWENSKRPLDEMKKKLAEESPALTKFTDTALTGLLDDLKNVIYDGNELALRFDVSSKAGELTADLALTAKPGTKLAASIKSWEAKSLFGAALGSDSAGNLLINAALAETTKKALAPLIDEGIEKALREEKNDAKRDLAEKFLKVLTPTLKAGELDLAFSLRGPTADNKYSALAGIKVKDGAAIDRTLRDIVLKLKKEEQALIKFDAQKIGTLNVHQVDIKTVEPRAKALFGEGPMYVAFRNDAVIFAGGVDALNVLKEAVTAKPAAAPAFQLELNFNRLVAGTSFDDQDFGKAAQQAFGGGKGNDKMRVSFEGGSALRLRFSMKGDVVRFLSEYAKLKGLVPPAQ